MGLLRRTSESLLKAAIPRPNSSREKSRSASRSSRRDCSPTRPSTSSRYPQNSRDPSPTRHRSPTRSIVSAIRQLSPSRTRSPSRDKPPPRDKSPTRKKSPRKKSPSRFRLRTKPSIETTKLTDHPILATDLLELTTPACDEITLSKMFTQQMLARSRTPSLSRSQGTLSSRGSPDPFTAEDGQHHFDESENYRSKESKLNNLPHLTNFVRECFCVELGKVDFTQALKSLDYLKAIDDRRKREFSAALRRLNIDTSTWDYEKYELKEKKPGVYKWIAKKEDKARRVEALYSQVWIGVRRWILINELRLTPFNRPACESMLATLFPDNATPPTPQLIPAIIESQRDGFKKYVDAVERQGRSVLKTLELQLARPGESNGWPAVKELIEKYVDTTESLIESLMSLTGPEELTAPPPPPPPPMQPLQQRGRTNSGTTDPNWRPQRPAHAVQTQSAPKVPTSGHAKSLSATNQSTLPKLDTSPSHQRTNSARTDDRPAVYRATTSPAQAQANGAYIPHHERKGSAIGRWARRFKSNRADDTDEESWGGGKNRRSASSKRSTSATPSTRSSSATPSHGRSMSRSGSAMSNHEERARTPLESSFGSDREQSLERGLGLGAMVIDDEHRAKMIAEARARRQEAEAKKTSQSQATHFKLAEERRRPKVERLDSDLSIKATQKTITSEPTPFNEEPDEIDMYRGRSKPRVYRMKTNDKWSPRYTNDEGGRFVAELEG